MSVGSGGTARIGLNSGGTAYVTRVNDGTQLAASPASVAAAHWAGRRQSSGGKDLWKNGAQYTAADAVSSTSVSTTCTLLATSTPGGFSNARIAGAYTGGAPVDARMAAMHVALQAYMQDVGVV
jgi:hypothetical protein